MAVTVADTLQLPALSNARLLTNTAGLERVVTSVSVLEYANQTSIQEEITSNIRFEGNELIITSFANIANDVDAQCANIRRFAAVGEVGLILYYVGILMPRVDSRLIKLGDELGFVIILMPQNDPTLAYANVISDIMQAVFLDQMHNPVFAVDMLDEIAKMPAYQQNLDTVQRMISDRLHASVALFDNNHQLIQSASWPRNQSVNWGNKLRSTAKAVAVQSGAGFIYREQVRGNKQLGDFELIIDSANRELDVYARSQAVAALQIGLNLWGRDSGTMDQMELLAAIVEDEPIKMRRLAEYYKIDVGNLRNMWVIPQFWVDDFSKARRELRSLSAEFATVAILERYEGMLVFFPTGNLDTATWNQWGLALRNYLRKNDIDSIPVRCQNVYTTSLVRSAIDLIRDAGQDATVIFPRKNYLTLGDVRLAHDCRQSVSGGARSMNAYIRDQLEPFGGDEYDELLQTLQVYLLDCNSSVGETAVQLFVHRNTVTYRMQKIAEIVGYPVGQMPETFDLYRLVGVLRLVQDARA